MEIVNRVIYDHPARAQLEYGTITEVIINTDRFVIIRYTDGHCGHAYREYIHKASEIDLLLYF